MGPSLAREAAGTALLVVRGKDGAVRAFRNACRHRGAQLACGTGCNRAFVCHYHGWTYGLDGSLTHIPHERGFPDIDKSTRGLVAVEAVERGGLVFLTQCPGLNAALDGLPFSLEPDLNLVSVEERVSKTN